MAVKFRNTLDALLHDLQAGGYSVQSVEEISGARGRCVDVVLENEVVVSWDRYTESIWTEGPSPRARRVESYLRCLYQSNWATRQWTRQRVQFRQNARSFVVATGRVSVEGRQRFSAGINLLRDVMVRAFRSSDQGLPPEEPIETPPIEPPPVNICAKEPM